MIGPPETTEAARRARVLALQRQRRKRFRRIDYYPSTDAEEIIETLLARNAGSSVSSLLDAIISEWAEIRKVKRHK